MIYVSRDFQLVFKLNHSLYIISHEFDFKVTRSLGGAEMSCAELSPSFSIFFSLFT